MSSFREWFRHIFRTSLVERPRSAAPDDSTSPLVSMPGSQPATPYSWASSGPRPPPEAQPSPPRRTPEVPQPRPPKLDVNELIAAAEMSMAQEAAAIVAADDHNAFALALHWALGPQRENLIYCPFSIRTALAMTYAGARGETANEMRVALRASIPEEGFHADWAATIRRLNPPSGTSYELAIANSLWSQAGVPLLLSFTDVMARHYGAAAHAVDFRGDPDAAREAINEWVSACTNHRIPDLLNPPLPEPDTRLILVNAVYFKGLWERPFDRERTHEAPFFREDGTEVPAPLMHQVTKVGYKKGPDYQAVTIPYRGLSFRGPALAMLVLLPDRKEGLRDLEAALSVPMIREFASLDHPTKVELFLPRFKITWGVVDLVAPLRVLGIQRAFTHRADFSGINGCEPPDIDTLFVSHVLHKAFSEVNEEGTEAAAATAVTALCMGIDSDSSPLPVFRADHAFLFAIVEAKSSAILFLGRVADPTRESMHRTL